MSIRSVPAFMAAAALLLTAAGPILAQEPAPAPKAAPASSRARESASRAKPKGKLKPVDINSAGKKELAFMLGISEELAAKIVAGRPYLTKARLLTQNVVSPEVYSAIKDKVVAVQPKPAR